LIHLYNIIVAQKIVGFFMKNYLTKHPLSVKIIVPRVEGSFFVPSFRNLQSEVPPMRKANNARKTGKMEVPI